MFDQQPHITSSRTDETERKKSALEIIELFIAKVRECIDACRQQALRLRVSQAVEILKTVQISAAMDDLEGRKAA